MPRSSSSLTRLAPDRPPLWRDGETIQFGEHGAVQVRVDEPWVEQVVSRLRRGIPIAAFDLVAHGFGAPRDAARDLLASLQPVLVTDPAPMPPMWVESANVADSRVGAWMQQSLDELGAREAARTDSGAVGVVLVHGAAAARQLHDHLRADLIHLPVAFEAGSITVGPLVIPGRTPCLACRDAQERDRDPAWPLVHGQLVGRTGTPITRLMVGDAARLVRRLLRHRSPGGRMLTVDAEGHRISAHSVRFHAECRCRESSFRSPPGSATEHARLDQPPATRTA